MNTEKFRCGKVTYTRKSPTDPWEQKQHESIALAKKANGLFARIVASPKELPKQQEAA